MSHHASGPDFGFPRGDARLDMTDLYVFSKPGDASKSIIILNVHPSFAVNPPGPTTAEPFAPGALYEIQVDTNGDAVADLNYSVEFSSSENGMQTAMVRRIHGTRTTGFGAEGEDILKDAPVSVGREALVTRAGDHRFFFGWRSDPIFFDANGFFNSMQFTGDDFFADKDVCSIVLELPNSALGSAEVGLWARTVDKTGEGWVQADRGGRPLQAVFLAGDSREAYLSGQPEADDRFIKVFAHELEHSGGYASGDAIATAKTLLPDILSYDPRRTTSFPDNGRTLRDDVVDVFFSIYTNGKVAGDSVGPHVDLLDDLPYLGPPHEIRRAASTGDFHRRPAPKGNLRGPRARPSISPSWPPVELAARLLKRAGGSPLPTPIRRKRPLPGSGRDA
jgi:Domain of unknown function (DUF4331)